MINGIDRLTASGCGTEEKEKLCRARGGESCAFDGAMIVLQPIADAAHIVHGPISCVGNSWEGRGSLSDKGSLHKMGFTTAMDEMDIIYGSEGKLYKAIVQTYEAVKPKAIFVYATCVSGLIGEDIGAVCKRAGADLNIPVISVNAPGFVGPKNLGNRIAGEVLLDRVIGAGEPPPPFFSPLSKGGMRGVINLIGEYNIAGDLHLVEPLLREAGINVLSRITGNAAFEEITYAHRAEMNVVACSRALINVAKEMKRKYGIPYVEVSFFGKTEMSKALRLIASNLESHISDFKSQISNLKLAEKTEAIIEREESLLEEKLKAYEHLKGKRAVLYTGGVKSWSFISALMDLGIEIAAVGTKKSTFEDEEKMKEILGNDAPLVEDVSPKNLLRLIRDKGAEILVAGGRNQYLAVKEGIPFVDVNQERHTAYAGYKGLINLARDISRSILFYEGKEPAAPRINIPPFTSPLNKGGSKRGNVVINPLGHSQSVGAVMALQGIDRAIPVIHGAQGCSFLQKVLLTKHFREPIALQSTKLFTEDVVMGSDEALERAINGIIEKNKPELIGALTSGLSEIKGDDVGRIIKNIDASCKAVHVPTPDYEGGLETGYRNAVMAVLRLAGKGNAGVSNSRINVLAGSHLTPADFTELREIIESFGLEPLILPDLSSLDGSRQGFSALTEGGIKVDEIKEMGGSIFTIAIGGSMEAPALYFKEAFGIEYRVFRSISGLRDTDVFMETLSMLGGRPVPPKYKRQRNILIDGLRDAHFHLRGKRVCIALEPDLSVQTSRWLDETGAEVPLSVVPVESPALVDIIAKEVIVGDLYSIEGHSMAEYPDLLIANSHAEDTAERLGVPLYEMGFPVYKAFGYMSKVTVGYGGTLGIVSDIANLLLRKKQ